ncbi:fibrillarin [Ferroglobus placidus DSM 10642]|uniref:Fibrillarin-like rRNA/tRNA 2'-O-methyltransferase n=1 Tax=Ferroglobus placidus (strain DSM 10642 / AEDII12DO) TaxID=589924 RepID=D3S0M9_FERPA|nr:fibrillarin-like rRNA/tRNA 2'-O-methyltransferase [Ferroglobus placidus]ADC66270.1 fibrillarin [Ferroglobus placidus DSM 10642]
MKSLRELEEVLPNTYFIQVNGKKILATKSKYPPFYGEKKYGEYREWIPTRSKLSAAIIKGLRPEIKEDTKVLYLGAASGTTVSHLSDIVEDGVIYAVEYSAKPFVKFLELAKERKNIIPLLEDARKPENYSGIVEKVDFIYQDIAQRDQIDIFIKNAEFFLKKGGIGIIMVKARSIDSTLEPERIFKNVERELKKRFDLLAKVDIQSYHKDHVCFYLRWRG